MMYLLNIIMLILMVLLSVAFLTLLERKILSYIQIRKGPNKIGFKGIIQPFSDALKLLSKEWNFYMLSNNFMLSPLMMLILSMLLWYIYPWMNMSLMYNGLIFFMVILGFNVYPVIMLAWGSSCNYSMLGSLRSVAQMISFEISLFLMLFIFMLLCESFMFLDFMFYQQYLKFFILLYPLYLMFIISMLIELNRTPFDLIEGESELVSGFNVEFYGSFFTMIFLAEYSSILFMGLILELMFFGFIIWSMNFMLIFLIHMLLILWIRGVLPRIRYDKLMMICWKEILIGMLFYLSYIMFLKYFMLMILS
uniref:NADH-ubiquinone oxidoreductase chain 1 n=1 Tax=Eucera floralia TaxID=599063 RepID=A0A343DRJ1_9HYME|nr:NADH dehydrogenase subunit 1 [Eucera floralia]